MDADRNFSGGEVKVKHKILALKYHEDKWCERCTFTKGDGEEIFKGIVSDYDTLK